MDENRLKHSLKVAEVMVEIAKEYGLSEEEQNDCFLLGYVHDIGYAYTMNKEKHNIVGGQILKNNGFKYWQEVYFHGEDECNFKSKYLDILNKADMQVDSKGNFVGYKERLKDIANRYGIDSKIYQKCKKLIDKLNEENNFK